jgi:hypothetical protein
MRHYKKKHKDAFHVEGRSHLDMVFTVTRVVQSEEADGDARISSEAVIEDASVFPIDTEIETIMARALGLL